MNYGPHRFAPRHLAAFAALAGLALGCGQDDRIVVPNRVLDRPLDAVLACVRDNGTQMEVLSLNQCDGARNFGRCDISGSPTPQLIGFVANSERNELAMFRRCDDEAALVDMDPEAPGYNFLPAGHLPSAMTITSDSCQAVSANVGSCDLTVLDVAGLAEYAVNTRLTGADAPEPPELPAPSTLVSTLTPRTSEGRVLASAPGRILAVPSALTQSGNATPDEDSDDGADDVGDAGTDDGDFNPGEMNGDDGGGDEPIPEGTVCDLSRPASVYVTFPSCQLVAEVSLTTQTVLQSRQFVTNDEGELELIDAGTDPQCPIDCPAQFDGDLPDEVELVDPNGVFPTSLALVTPSADFDDLDDDVPEAQVFYSTLFVGGPGSDTIWEIELDDNGRFGPTAEALTLEDAQGVQTIRATPPDNVLGAPHQFLYVIVGDGSTRVVDRDFDQGSLGIECDTQIDPTLEAPTACHPINPGQASNAIDRRPFAVGPGIRAAGGATINDWAFHKLDESEAQDFCNTGDNDQQTLGLERTPFCTPSLVGVGVTSLGTVIYSSFGQFSDTESISEAVDPVGVMNVQVRPHSLWPAVDPFVATPVPESLPLVADEEPGRAIPGGGADAFTLAPSIRRIDLAYSAEASDGDVSELQQSVADRLGNPRNADRLGSRSGEGLYENQAPRVAVRDFQQWGSQTWSLEWEPTIPGTTSSTGLMRCDNHGSGGSPGGTCRNVEEDDARLIDESANFCEDGVLAGDKLVVLGCLDDAACGLGQRCLRDPTAPTTATGICVSELAYQNERESLRNDCAAFISDPCGSPRREYRVTRAFDDELWLQGLELPRRSIVRNMAADGEAVELYEYEPRLSCEAPIRRVEGDLCDTDDDCLVDPYDADNLRGDMTCDLTGVDEDNPGPGRCVGDQPDGGCTDDTDCVGLGAQYLCVDSLCRAPCELCPPPVQPDEPCRIDDDCVGDTEVCVAGTCHAPCTDGNPGCLRSPLPGPRCFPELVRYSVRLHESMAFSGSSTPFLTDRVVADTVTGECVEDPEVSSLLTSRIRLGSTAAATFGTDLWQIPDCVNPDEAGPDDPNPCRIVADRFASAEEDSLFHTFSYDGQPVPAIRYSNPVMSVVIDLVSLTGLTSDPADFGDQVWPSEFVEFLRSRIPDGYREEFASINGFVPFNEGVVVVTTPLVYPVRIIKGPEPAANFIVDAGGRGGIAGVRGQVVRIDHAPGQVLTDSEFLVR